MSEREFPLPEESGAFAAESGEWSAPREGRYVKESLLGRGGMGEVWQAHDRVLRRVVALKIGRDQLTESQRIRLMREARITAGLDHPGIVPVYDAGTDPDGHPFYTMRVVRGRTLADALRACETDQDRLDLLPHLLAACDAVAFAHEAGVVHRDLKPDNIQVGVFGETQVMDWGLARAPDDDDAWRRVLSQLGTRTQAGVVLGTPAYMSPEQAAARDATAASDVWSLGLILYELVAGQRAYKAPSSQQLMAQVLAGPPPPLRELAPDTPPELAAILDKALQHAPGDRYPNARALAADLRAWLLGKRVGAHRYSVADELQRQLKRWRVPVLAALAGIVGLASAGGVGIWRAEQERQRLETAEQELAAALVQSDANLARALVAQAVTAEVQDNWGQAEVLAARSLVLERTPEAIGVLAGARSAERPRLVGGFELPQCDTREIGPTHLICARDGTVQGFPLDGGAPWTTKMVAESIHLDSVGNAFTEYRSSMRRLDAQTGEPTQASFPHIGHRQIQSLIPGELAKSDYGTSRKIWWTEDIVWQEAEVCDRRLYAGAVLEPGRFAVICSPQTLTLQGPEGARDIALTDDIREPFVLAFSPDTERFAVGGMFGEVVVYDTQTDQVTHRADFGDAMMGMMTFSPDGTWLAVDFPGDGAWIIDLERGGAHHKLPRGPTGMAFTPDGRLAVLVGDRVEIWQLPERARPPMLRLVDGGIVGLDWAPWGMGITAGQQAFRVDADWTLHPGPTRDDNAAKAVLVHPDGSVTWGTLFGLYGGRIDALEELDAAASVRRLLRLKDDTIAYLGRTPWIERGGERLPGGALLDFYAMDGRASPEEDAFVVVSSQGRLVWCGVDPLTWRELGTWSANSVAVGPGGWPVYVGHSGGIWTLDAQGTQSDFAEIEGPVYELAVSHDGRFLAAATRDRRIRVFDRETGELLATMQGHQRRVTHLVFAPDEPVLASGSWDSTVRFWDLGVLEEDPQRVLDEALAQWGLSLE